MWQMDRTGRYKMAKNTYFLLNFPLLTHLRTTSYSYYFDTYYKPFTIVSSMPQPQFPYVPLYCTPGALYPHWSSWRRDGAKEMRLVKGDLIYEHDEIYTKPLASYQYLEPYLAGKDVGEMRCQLHDSWILFTGNEHIPTTGSENAISIIVGSGAAGMAQTVSKGGQE